MSKGVNRLFLLVKIAEHSFTQNLNQKISFGKKSSRFFIFGHFKNVQFSKPPPTFSRIVSKSDFAALCFKYQNFDFKVRCNSNSRILRKIIRRQIHLHKWSI